MAQRELSVEEAEELREIPCASAGPYSSSLPKWRMSLPLTM